MVLGVTIQIPSNTNGFSSFSPLHCNFMGILHCRTHPNILLLLEHFMKYSRKAACKYPIVHFAHLYPHILPIKYPLHISIYLQIFFGMSYHVAVFPTFCKENMAIGKGQRAAQLGGRCSSWQRVSKWGRGSPPTMVV